MIKQAIPTPAPPLILSHHFSYHQGGALPFRTGQQIVQGTTDSASELSQLFLQPAVGLQQTLYLLSKCFCLTLRVVWRVCRLLLGADLS